MTQLHTLLTVSAIGAVALWAALFVYVVLVQRRRDQARATMSTAIATLAGADVRRLPLPERIDQIRALVASVPRSVVMRAVSDARTSPGVSEVLAASLVERWGIEALERDAASHQTTRGKWRRMTALRILFHADPARGLRLLARALEESDADVASVALALLGESGDPAAAELLIAALRVRLHPRTRIAVHVDRSPQHLAASLRPLLTDADPLVRRWSATLLGRYGDVPELERDLALAADDSDPRVRKAAVQSLGQMGDTLAAATALRLANDPIPFVRTAAVRAIGKLDRFDLATEVAPHLGDCDWWVRFAAKECLESMGPDVWPVLVRLLDDPDRFVRNGAAEVFQNLGVLDSFIVMEAATDEPAAGKIELLRRIAAAGGLRLTDSLLVRAGTLGQRVRQLLSNVGLEHVGAA